MNKEQVPGGGRREEVRGLQNFIITGLLFYSFVLRTHCLGHVEIHLEAGCCSHLGDGVKDVWCCTQGNLNKSHILCGFLTSLLQEFLTV